MKKFIFVTTIIIGCFTPAAKKVNQKPELPNIEQQMEKAEKIAEYKAKKDVAWHKTEYNKVLKYLNKSQNRR